LPNLQGFLLTVVVDNSATRPSILAEFLSSCFYCYATSILCSWLPTSARTAQLKALSCLNPTVSTMVVDSSNWDYEGTMDWPWSS